MGRTEFIRYVSERLASDPSLIGEVMGACTMYWSAYEKHVKSRRNNESLRAIEDMIGTKYRGGAMKEREVVACIEAVKHNFPNGYDDVTSPATRMFLDRFVDGAMEAGMKPEDDFIAKIRGFSELLSTLYEQKEQQNENKNRTD